MSVLFASACADAPREPAAPPKGEAAAPYASWPDTLAQLPQGAAQAVRVCGRPGQNSVLHVFCSGEPWPQSLAELQTRFGVGKDDLTALTTLRNGSLRALSVSGHSTSLSKRSVSAINPRLIALAISLKPATASGTRTTDSRLFALGFTRGEQFVEMVSSDYADQSLHFYVLGFRQACNQQPGGCTPADLLTEAVESNWTETNLYDESDLANTVLDCAPCHQADGPGTAKLLRMQEIDSPWTHWFSPNTEGGRALLVDYMAAHAAETYGGMPAARIAQADPSALASLAFLSNPAQPNKFDSTLIEGEVKSSAAALGGEQPVDNSVTGTSNTWNVAFGRASRGEAIPVPYLNVKVTDAGKLAAMTAAYQAYRSGQLKAAELPDIRDVFPESLERLAEMGIATTPGLDGDSVLISACSQCHNEKLDQSISRARFRADLADMDRSERDVAITRLSLPPDNPLAMPPARIRILSAEARERAIARLREP